MIYIKISFYIYNIIMSPVDTLSYISDIVIRDEFGKQFVCLSCFHILCRYFHNKVLTTFFLSDITTNSHTHAPEVIRTLIS